MHKVSPKQSLKKLAYPNKKEIDRAIKKSRANTKKKVMYFLSKVAND